MVTETLFVVDPKWKRPKCPSGKEWINKMWCMYTIEYYAAIKKNEVLGHVITWMNLENVMLSGRSQTQKTM